ncbi:hypothetical protein [Streptomyces rectiverticillatus]|uniref:hypothetical protein n=1 Tax=Streptomyces rectiverticillatus TaxID=173860 RepID=UPI001FEAA9BA|nr:hypothetical protein [Streptomyces rectiverticillatus]
MSVCPGWWDTSTEVERREKLISWGVEVYVTTAGIRFECGEGFPATVQMAELRFDADARTAELVTHGGGVTTFPLPMGARGVALAA